MPLYNYFVKNILYIPIYIIINLQYMYLISLGGISHDRIY